jgi:predicted regulator of Ras-like GTPase activity (Roadblock/LC7/MglB family)
VLAETSVEAVPAGQTTNALLDRPAFTDWHETTTEGVRVRVSTAEYLGQDLGSMITNLVERVPDVAHAAVVSSDGLPLATSAGFPPDYANQLAAITSGLAGLTHGASRVLGWGMVAQTVVEMQRGVVVVMAVSNGACLAVLATSGDLGLIGYEMTLLAKRAGRVLTSAARDSAAQRRNTDSRTRRFPESPRTGL